MCWPLLSRCLQRARGRPGGGARLDTRLHGEGRRRVQTARRAAVAAAPTAGANFFSFWLFGCCLFAPCVCVLLYVCVLWSSLDAHAYWCLALGSLLCRFCFLTSPLHCLDFHLWYLTGSLLPSGGRAPHRQGVHRRVDAAGRDRVCDLV
jgi:hypothetical protein